MNHSSMVTLIMMSANVMAETFQSFGRIVETGTPQEIKSLIPQIVEVIEWHEDPENPGSGHYRMGYFEQPRLKVPRYGSESGPKNPTVPAGNTGTAGSTSWLQRQDSNL